MNRIEPHNEAVARFEGSTPYDKIGPISIEAMQAALASEELPEIFTRVVALDETEEDLLALEEAQGKREEDIAHQLAEDHEEGENEEEDDDDGHEENLSLPLNTSDGRKKRKTILGAPPAASGREAIVPFVPALFEPVSSEVTNGGETQGTTDRVRAEISSSFAQNEPVTLSSSTLAAETSSALAASSESLPSVEVVEAAPRSMVAPRSMTLEDVVEKTIRELILPYLEESFEAYRAFFIDGKMAYTTILEVVRAEVYMAIEERYYPASIQGLQMTNPNYDKVRAKLQRTKEACQAFTSEEAFRNFLQERISTLVASLNLASHINKLPNYIAEYLIIHTSETNPSPSINLNQLISIILLKLPIELIKQIDALRFFLGEDYFGTDITLGFSRDRGPTSQSTYFYLRDLIIYQLTQKGIKPEDLLLQSNKPDSTPPITLASHI